MAKKTLSEQQGKTKRARMPKDSSKPILELSVKICDPPDKKAPPISNSISAMLLLQHELRDKDREHFICLHMNQKNIVIAKEIVSIGSLSASIVHPREAFKAAVLNGSAAVIFAHNHPSGDPTPSREDMDITQRLWNVANLLGIRLLDHIIIAGHKSYSFADDNRLEDPSPPEWANPPKSREEKQRRKEIKLEVRRIRRKLKLTPRRANDLFFPRGEGSFYLLEAGRTEPDAATFKLLRLLDKRPELLKEIANI